MSSLRPPVAPTGANFSRIVQNVNYKGSFQSFKEKLFVCWVHVHNINYKHNFVKRNCLLVECKNLTLCRLVPLQHFHSFWRLLRRCFVIFQSLHCYFWAAALFTFSHYMEKKRRRDSLFPAGAVWPIYFVIYLQVCTNTWYINGQYISIYLWPI